MSTREEGDHGSGLLALTTVAGRHPGDNPPTEESQRNEITKAELVVRTADWHPVEAHLLVNDREYEIAELDYKVLPLSEVDAAVFAEPPAPVERVAAPRPVLEPPVPPQPDPEETEMAVRHGLHQLDADLGEPIEISYGSQGKVIVDASGVAPELQAKLQQQLAPIPNARLEVDRPPSPRCEACPAPTQETQETLVQVPTTALSIAPVVNPNEKRLEEIFGDPHAQESFTR